MSLSPIEIATGGWLLSVILAMAGWIFHSSRQRVLQRKHLAVQLLNQNRFEKEWLDSSTVVFEIIRTKKNYKWEKLADKRYGAGKLVGAELKLFRRLLIVLNSVEFIAVAILNKTADQDVIRFSEQSTYLELHRSLEKFIGTARRHLKDKSIYLNFTTLMERWADKPQPVIPTPWWAFWR